MAALGIREIEPGVRRDGAWRTDHGERFARLALAAKRAQTQAECLPADKPDVELRKPSGVSQEKWVGFEAVAASRQRFAARVRVSGSGRPVMERSRAALAVRAGPADEADTGSLAVR